MSPGLMPEGKHAMIRIITSAALAFAAVAGTAASAEDAPTAIVTYADLNLSSTAGVAALDQRISAAASQICGTVDIRDLQGKAAVNACRTTAVRSAAAQIATLTSQTQEVALNVTRVANR
jgi:UrcA family protein